MAATILETAVERKPPPGNHPGRGNLACVTHAHRKDTIRPIIGPVCDKSCRMRRPEPGWPGARHIPRRAWVVPSVRRLLVHAIGLPSRHRILDLGAQDLAGKHEMLSCRPAGEPRAFPARKRLVHNNGIGHAAHNAARRHCRPNGRCPCGWSPATRADLRPFSGRTAGPAGYAPALRGPWPAASVDYNNRDRQ